MKLLRSAKLLRILPYLYIYAYTSLPFALLLFLAAQREIRCRYVTVAAGVFVQVLLVIILGGIEIPKRLDNDRERRPSLFLLPVEDFLYDRKLLRLCIENVNVWSSELLNKSEVVGVSDVLWSLFRDPPLKGTTGAVPIGIFHG